MSGKTATERLREMLDERGVAHSDHYLSTTWRDGNGILHLAGEPMADGSLVVDMLTPEQAIAATLGNSRAERTCKMQPSPFTDWAGLNMRIVAGWYCENCGECCLTETTIDDDHPTPNYCPNCGAKVVGE